MSLKAGEVKNRPLLFLGFLAQCPESDFLPSLSMYFYDMYTMFMESAHSVFVFSDWPRTRGVPVAERSKVS